MTFDRGWVLFLAWLPFAWAAMEWRRTSRHAALALKALSFVAILIALAEPSITVSESKLAVAVLVDTSASMTPADLEKASGIVRQMSSARGRNDLAILPFGRTTRPLTSAETSGTFKLTASTGDAARATDLEAAVGDAIASLPAGKIPRLALITDGLENQGSLARAAWQARQVGIPIDTFALTGRPQPAVHIESLSVAPVAFTGERFPIDLLISAPSAMAADVELSAEGQTLGRSPVALTAGENPLRFHTSLNTAGALDLSIAIRPQGSPEVRIDQSVTLRRPKALYVSGDLADEDKHILGVLTGAQFDVKAANALDGLSLNNYQLVVLNNWDLEGTPPASKSAIEEYVREGGGLIVIGGDHNTYTEKKGPEDPLERTLPAKLAPPRSPEGTAVILIIDKSSSMEGRKIELARLASIGVVNNLRPIDRVGVLIFDNTFEWALPIRLAENKEFINNQIAGIRPDGGTQIAPALQEALSRMQPVNATSRHIVLLTDGISEEGNTFNTTNAATAAKITISTIGLGQDVNRTYLEKIAQAAGGKSYFVLDPGQLEQILIKDVAEHTGTTTVERQLSPEVAKRVELLAETGMEKAPQLKGYVRFISKPTAETILTIDKKDPLLVRWQYGLGRAAVFASDAKSRWAAEWIAWPGFDKFWTNVARDLLPRTQDGEATLSLDSANSELVATYRLGRGVPEPAMPPSIFAFGPNNFHKLIPIQKIAVGTYQGRLPIGALQGLFRVRPEEESRAFPEIGLYRPEAELTEYGSNAALLKQVAQFTGGRFEPPANNVFTGTGRRISTTLTLWPAFLAAAVLLSLAELVLRKWKGIFAGRFAS